MSEQIECSECGKPLDAKNNDDFYHEICRQCIYELPNETGYCSISCRLSGICDGSC